MAFDKNSYFIEKDDQILVDVPYLEAYMPANLFDRGINKILGEKSEVFGLFNFRASNNIGEIDKYSELETFKFPSMMMTKPDSIEKKDIILREGKKQKKYLVFKYLKGQPIIVNTQVVQSVANKELMMEQMGDGGLLDTIAYSDIPKVIFKNFEINQPLEVEALVITTAISNFARYSKDTTRAFRHIIGKGEASEYEYNMVNAREVCANDSTIAALTFEDPDFMLISSINRKRMGRGQSASPLDNLIK